jgi:flagellar L-ring protein precursor FlgH
MKCLAALSALALGVSVATVVVMDASQAAAEDLFQPNSFSAMATDRHAARVGDSLTVVINETSTATNSNKTNSAKSNSLLGQLNIGSKSHAIQMAASNGFDGSAETSHAGKMLAQLSVIVDQVLPNGDLRVSGYQALNINGERTRIRLSGRVRSADISNNNSVLSTSLADAIIDYDGKGFVANGARPGIISRIFNWLGLI